MSDFKQKEIVSRRKKTTPEQNELLEEVFSVNVNPTLAQREDLATKLAINERSLRIWFQNRRAKGKALEKRPSVTTQFVQRVTFTASFLKIGSYSTLYLEEECGFFADFFKEALCWEICVMFRKYRIEVAFQNLKHVEFLKDKGEVKVQISLHAQPLFSVLEDGVFVQCGDFTQGCEASFNLTHELTGNESLEIEFTSLLQSLSLQCTVSPDLPLSPLPVGLPRLDIESFKSPLKKKVRSRKGSIDTPARKYSMARKNSMLEPISRVSSPYVNQQMLSLQRRMTETNLNGMNGMSPMSTFNPHQRRQTFPDISMSSMDTALFSDLLGKFYE